MNPVTGRPVKRSAPVVAVPVVASTSTDVDALTIAAGGPLLLWRKRSIQPFCTDDPIVRFCEIAFAEPNGPCVALGPLIAGMVVTLQQSMLGGGAGGVS